MNRLTRIVLVTCAVIAVLPLGGLWYLTRLDGENPGAKAAAMKSLQAHGIAPASAKVLVVVDFDKPSYAKRGMIYDMVSGEKRAFRVAHGAGSSRQSEPYATEFSNELDSHQSSLGLFRIGKLQPSPEHGTKIMLYGLDQELNGLAERRAIVIHAPKPDQNYISWSSILGHLLTKGWAGVGRSHGCPVLSPEDYKYLQERIARSGTMNFLYVYHRSLTS